MTTHVSRLQPVRHEQLGVRLTGPDAGDALLRPLGDGEIEPLLAVFEGMSAESRYSRYFVPLERLTSSMLESLTHVDGDDHVAWLATIAGRPAGVARYIRTRPDTAEIAFEVVDAHQRRGLGAALLDVITTAACVKGI